MATGTALDVWQWEMVLEVVENKLSGYVIDVQYLQRKGTLEGILALSFTYVFLCLVESPACNRYNKYLLKWIVVSFHSDINPNHRRKPDI